jgi:hypothetical protein
MLAVGIGAVATRDRDEMAEQLTVEFKTEGVGVPLDSTSGPRALPPVPAPASVGALAGRGRPGAAVGSADADLASAGRSGGAAVANADAISADASGVGGAGVASARTRSPEAAATQSAVAPRIAAAPPPPAALQRTEKSIATSASVAAEESRNVAGRAALDTATRRIGSTPLRLSEVVVTGTTAGGGTAAQARDAGAAFSAAAPAATVFGGACFALDVIPSSESVGISLLPRRMRIRLAESPKVALDSRMSRSDVGASNLRGASEQQAASRAPLAFGAISSEPAEALSWGMPSADSVVAQLTSAPDVVEFRLEVLGDQVKGTALVQASAARPATVTGRRISCGGG